MNRFNKTTLFIALVGWSFSALALAAPAAQDPESKPHFPPMKEVLQGGGTGEQSAEDRMRELFSLVESNLQTVDALLGEAAAGDTTRLTEVKDASIADLLRNSLERGRAAQKGIREIIELAKQQGGPPSPSSSSGKGEQSGSGSPSSSDGQGSPLDGGQQSQSAEQTPEMGDQPGEGEQSGEGEKPGGEKPENKPGGEKPSEGQDGADPKQGGEADGEGENREGHENGEGDAGQSPNNAQAADGWGDLPSHVQETFRSAGRSELPARYRDWIDDYYRKLNRRGDR